MDGRLVAEMSGGASPDRDGSATDARVGDYVDLPPLRAARSAQPSRSLDRLAGAGIDRPRRTPPWPSTARRGRAGRRPKRPGEWFELDLGQIRPITQVSLLSAPWTADAPPGLRVETSVDGQRWETVANELGPARRPPLVEGSSPARRQRAGHRPLRAAPESLRAPDGHRGRGPGAQWSIAELFVYETAASPWSPPPAAAAALRRGDRASWTTGWTTRPDRIPCAPLPPRAPSRPGPLGLRPSPQRTMRWRRRRSGRRRTTLYGRPSRGRAGGDGLEWLLDRARSDGAWPEVVRLAELIDAQPDAHVARRAPGRRRPRRSSSWDGRPRPPRSAPARSLSRAGQFGSSSARSSSCVGVDGPPAVRPGETVRLAYHWRLLESTSYDYWVFLHVVGSAGRRKPRRDRGRVRILPLGRGRARPADRRVHGPSGHSAGHLPATRRGVAPVHGPASPHPGVGRAPSAPRGLARVPRRRPLTSGRAPHSGAPPSASRLTPSRGPTGQDEQPVNGATRGEP